MRLGDRSLPEGNLKRIEDRIARTGRGFAKDLVLRARFEASAFIGERDPDRLMLDQEVDRVPS